MSEKNNRPEGSNSDRDLEDLYAQAIRYVRSKVPEQDAHDLVQDSLVVFTKKSAEIINPRAYLFKIISNKLKQYYEKNRRGLAGVALSAFEDSWEAMPMSVMSTRLSIRVARGNDLAAAMQALPKRQYQAFELRYAEGLEIEEAADALEVSPATLKRDIQRARETLASVLGDASDEHELGRIVRAYLRG